MAIERMKIVWLFDAQGRERHLLGPLAAMGLSHVSDSGMPPPERAEHLGIVKVLPNSHDLERRVRMFQETLDALAPFAKTSRDLLANFINTPIEVTSEEVRSALDIQDVYETVREAARQHGVLVANHDKAAERLRALETWRGVEATVPGEGVLRRTAMFVGVMAASQFARLTSEGKLPETCAVAAAARAGRRVLAQAVCPIEQQELLAARLRECAFERFEPEPQSMTISEYVQLREEGLGKIAAELRDCEKRLRELAVKHRRRLELALGYWEERQTIAEAAGLMARSKRLTVLKGFVRETDLDAFKSRLAEELPDVAMIARDPGPDEVVPVSLRNNRFFAPAQFLVNMFGLPQYFTFDPTPVIFFSFLLFFGFCFGDVVYGAMLLGLGLLLARKYREYPNLRNFFMLLAYASVPTMIAGALLGSWAGDLYRPEYLGQNNIFSRINAHLMVADPVDKALPFLMIALAIGMTNQLIAIVMLMVRNIRQKDYTAAVFDSVPWLILLPAFVALIAGLFVAVPPTITRIAWIAAGISAATLIATQGRAEKGIATKIVVGVTSLYGIVGTYGITTFIGDTLSYSRLLALGLTTGIVAMSFNMIAGMTKNIPVVGIVAFLAILIFGHLLNFVLSIMGGFVHSARLTFVEFFGRFYNGGALRFAPLGTWRGRIRVTDRKTVWEED